jgi:hypothetical protein
LAIIVQSTSLTLNGTAAGTRSNFCVIALVSTREATLQSTQVPTIIGDLGKPTAKFAQPVVADVCDEAHVLRINFDRGEYRVRAYGVTKCRRPVHDQFRLFEQVQRLCPLRIAEIGADNIVLGIGDHVGVFPSKPSVGKFLLRALCVFAI